MTSSTVTRPVRYSQASWFLTALTVILIAAMGMTWIDFDDIWQALTFWLCIVVLASALWYAPLYVSVSDNALRVRRPLAKLVIPIEEIDSVRTEPHPSSVKAIRICGSGGFMGYWGWFREQRLGKYFAYYGKPSDCFLITLRNGRKYMLGCNDPQAIVNAIASASSKF